MTRQADSERCMNMVCQWFTGGRARDIALEYDIFSVSVWINGIVAGAPGL